jgi:ketosteroid isomerase-like protein
MPFADAIAAASRTFEADFERGDISALVSNYYTDDPVVVGQGIGIFRGHEGARAYFTNASSNFARCILKTSVIEEVNIDCVFEIGTVDLIPRDPTASQVHLSYLVSWQNLPGLGWRVAMDYFTPQASRVPNRSAIGPTASS